MNSRPRIRMALLNFLSKVAAWGVVMAAAVACAAATLPVPTPLVAKSPRSAEVAEGTAYEQRIIWQSQPKGEALFIPQQVWDSTAFEELPLSSLDRTGILYWLGLGEKPVLPRTHQLPDRADWLAEQRAKFAEPIADCQILMMDFREPRKDPSGQPRPLHELFIGPQAGLVAEVVAVVAGASAGGSPAEAAYLRVEEILQDRAGLLRPGMVLATVRNKGTFVYRGVKRCDEGRPKLLNIQAGDRVLVAGVFSGEDTEVLNTVYELKIVDGMLQEKPNLNTTDTLPMPLEALLGEVVATVPGRWALYGEAARAV